MWIYIYIYLYTDKKNIYVYIYIRGTCSRVSCSWRRTLGAKTIARFSAVILFTSLRMLTCTISRQAVAIPRVLWWS